VSVYREHSRKTSNALSTSRQYFTESMSSADT